MMLLLKVLGLCVSFILIVASVAIKIFYSQNNLIEKNKDILIQSFKEDVRYKDFSDEVIYNHIMGTKQRVIRVLNFAIIVFMFVFAILLKFI